MLRTLDQRLVTVKNVHSVVGFVETGTETWPQWYRFLTIDGTPVFKLGNICGTCEFFFERVSEAPSVKIGSIKSELDGGIQRLSYNVVAPWLRLLPSGEYLVQLLLLCPGPLSQADWEDGEVLGDSHYYPVLNSQAQTMQIDEQGDLEEFNEFLIPSHPTFDENAISSQAAAMEAGFLPTAVSVSILDVKRPYDKPAGWTLGHYLLDGHHKVSAASRSNRPITLLSFIAHDKGILGENDLRHYQTVAFG